MLNNPQGSYRIVGGDSQSAPHQGAGGVLGFLGNIFSAPIDLGKKAIEGTRYAVGSLGGQTDFKPITMSEEEWNQFRRGDPLGSTLKDMFGTAAIAAGPEAGAVLPGALGGLSIADWEDPMDVLKKTATGGVLGGAIGLGAQGISKGLGKMATPKVAGAVEETATTPGIFQKAGAKVRAGSEGMERNALKRIIGGGQVTDKLGGANLLKDTAKFSKVYDIPINSADDALKLSARMFEDYGTVVKDKIAEGLPGQPDVTAIRNLLQNKFDNAVGSDQKAIQQVINDLDDWVARKGNSWESMYSFKQNIGPKGKWSLITDPDLQPRIKAYEDVYKTINNQLDSAIGPEFREANKMVERSIQLQQYAQKGQIKDIPGGFWTDPMQDLAMAGAVVGGAPGAAAGAAVNKFMMGPQGQRFLAKGASKVADVLEKGPGAVKGPNVSNILGSKIMQGAGQQLGKTIPYLPGLGTAGIMRSDFGGGNVPQTGAPDIPSLGAMGGPSLGMTAGMSGMPEVDPRMLAMKFVNQGMDLDQAMKAAQFFGSQGQEEKKLTENQMKANAAINQMAEARQMLESDQVGQGRVQDVKSKVSGLLGGGGGLQDEYRAKLAGARSMAISMLSGANVPPSEYERLAGMIPEDTDSKARAISKMNAFIGALQQFTNQQGMAPQIQGSDMLGTQAGWT